MKASHHAVCAFPGANYYRAIIHICTPIVRAVDGQAPPTSDLDPIDAADTRASAEAKGRPSVLAVIQNITPTWMVEMAGVLHSNREGRARIVFYFFLFSPSCCVHLAAKSDQRLREFDLHDASGVSLSAEYALDRLITLVGMPAALAYLRSFEEVAIKEWVTHGRDGACGHAHCKSVNTAAPSCPKLLPFLDKHREWVPPVGGYVPPPLDIAAAPSAHRHAGVMHKRSALHARYAAQRKSQALSLPIITGTVPNDAAATAEKTVGVPTAATCVPEADLLLKLCDPPQDNCASTSPRNGLIVAAGAPNLTGDAVSDADCDDDECHVPRANGLCCVLSRPGFELERGL